MSEHEPMRDEIIVMGNEQSPVFCVAVIALNQRHRRAGDFKELIRPLLPLGLANQLAKSEGQRRGLPVTIWCKPAAGEVELEEPIVGVLQPVFKQDVT